MTPMRSRECSGFGGGYLRTVMGLGERPAMGRISFTANLQRHLSCPSVEVRAATVREAIDEVLAGNPRLRPYLLDEHGRLRRHVNVYINDVMISDRVGLSDALAADDEVYVFQALSGG